MKKILLLSFIALGSVQIHAQYIGLKAGYNYTNMRGDTSEGASVAANHGFYAGIAFEVPLSKFFSFQPELLYNRVGAKFVSPTTGNANLTVDYISIPVLGRINFLRNVNLHLGPQFSYKADSNTFYFEKNGTNTVVDKKAIDTFDFSWVVGLGYQTPIGWFAEVRIVRGLSNNFDVNDSSLRAAGFSPDYNFKSTAISVGVGYIF
ncbi:MAG: porin family protein [Capnocytophaga sp.]|nr:porin family protein [Capnocytophaga sp.]